MINKELKEILIEFQTQINDLLQLQLDLNLSFNGQAKQLNDDFCNVYEEIYNAKTLKKAKEFLKSKEFMANELNKITDERTNNVIKMFDERFEDVHKNLEKIKNIL
jgi:hypothetical protein